MQTNPHKICILGSANVDSFVYVKHIPVPGQTIQADKYMIANGGKGANQAAAAGKLSGGCIFTGQVGIDDEMKNLKKEMIQANVTLAWKQLADTHTGKAFIYVDQTTGENSIVIIGGANIHYSNLETLPQNYKAAIDQCQILQLQKQIPMQINVLAAKYAKQKGKLVMLDCGGRDDIIPTQLLENLDYISPNQTEVLRIDSDVDVDNPVDEIREKIIGKYPKLKVLLKLGSKGSTLITDKIHIHGDVATKINPKCLQKYKIVDTVGAGDCFTSAFCVKLMESDWSDQAKWLNNYRQALIFGNCAAFLCITKKGAMPSMPDRVTTDKFIQEYGMFQDKSVVKVEAEVKSETTEPKVQATQQIKVEVKLYCQKSATTQCCQGGQVKKTCSATICCLSTQKEVQVECCEKVECNQQPAKQTKNEEEHHHHDHHHHGHHHHGHHGHHDHHHHHGHGHHHHH